MAKKKAVGKKSTKKKKTVVKRKTGGRKKSAPVVGQRKKKPATKKASAKRGKATRKKKTGKRAKQPSLGRPRVTADARLDQVFQKDYQAREVFDFLGVGTLRELETYAPDEIIDKLTGPMVQTVQRIRKTLALVNRSLANDRDFALEFKSRL